MEFKVGFSLFKPFPATHLIAERKVCLQGITSRGPSFPSQSGSAGQLPDPTPWEARKWEKRGSRPGEGESSEPGGGG